MKSIAFGPYIGDFKYEIFYFLPYIKWVKEILSPEDIYISSHYNRKFLYKNLVKEFFCVDPLLSADELNQKNHYNLNIFKNKYSVMEKEFKILMESIDSDVVQYAFDYSRFRVPCSVYQLKHEKLDYDFKYRFSDKFVFIPDRSENEQYLKKVLEYLKQSLGDKLVVLGDKKTFLQKENTIIDRENYNTIVYKEIINAISSCRAVITPSSVWTGIANLQGSSVFSWGESISEYKDGIYRFENSGKYYPSLEFSNLRKCLDIFLEEKC